MEQRDAEQGAYTPLDMTQPNGDVTGDVRPNGDVTGYEAVIARGPNNIREEQGTSTNNQRGEIGVHYQNVNQAETPIAETEENKGSYESLVLPEKPYENMDWENPANDPDSTVE